MDTPTTMYTYLKALNFFLFLFDLIARISNCYAIRIQNLYKSDFYLNRNEYLLLKKLFSSQLTLFY